METVMSMKVTTKFLLGMNYISLLQVEQNKTKLSLK